MEATFSRRELIRLLAGGAGLARFEAGQKQFSLEYPNGLAVSSDGRLFISDIGSHRVLRLERSGRLTHIAGTGNGGFSGDEGTAVSARLNGPHDLLFDNSGNLLIADTLNHRIRRVDRSGIITTIAGNGKSAFAGDGGPATEASLNGPQGMALDNIGNLLIADTWNHRIRRVDRSGIISTIAGTVPGFGGDGGPASACQINLPMAVVASPDGSVFLSDAANSRIRRIDADGTIRTIIGFGPGQDLYGAGFSGDGGPPEKARIFSATDLKLDSAGNLYISDSGNHRVRLVRDGLITTIAGSGRQGAGGDSGSAVDCELNTPQKICHDRDGSLFIADRANRRIRKVDSRGIIRTIAGSGAAAGMMLDRR